MQVASQTGIPPGSSPLARGTLLQRCGDALDTGLIPARAGNTGLSSGSGLCAGAHPRSRGEHGCGVLLVSVGGGSSPLARGAQLMSQPHRTASGLIPARAGSTSVGGARRDFSGAHPRSRGEHVVFTVSHSPATGSSPLARGARTVHKWCLAWFGLIPARAGSTAARRGSVNRVWAHPRSRGEHDYAAVSGVPARGSSPLARGAPGFPEIRVDSLGLIPARAGSTWD